MRRKNNKILLLLVILLTITVGYALISTTLKITGTASVKKQTWSVYWDVPVVKEGSVSTTIPTRTHDENDPANTKLIWTVEFDTPGDFYEFTVDAVNAGTIDAMVTGMNNIVTPSLPNYIKYDVTYVDGAAIANNHLLAKKQGNTPTTEKYKVRVYYDEAVATGETINAIPDGGNSYTFTFNVTYSQATSDAIERPTWFGSTSWNDIISNYNNGNPTQELKYAMENGDTKEVALDLDHDGEAETIRHLRIANLSKPAECSGEGFSQSACGFVLEFQDIITNHRMNPQRNETEIDQRIYTMGTGNFGGWKYSDMRAYLNGTVYEHENIDYTGRGIIDALPSDLKNRIIDTTIVSGYGDSDPDTYALDLERIYSTNLITTDKLYLLSTHEVWEDDDNKPNAGIDYGDSAYSNTRQLDYYLSKEVTTTSNYEAAIKNEYFVYDVDDIEVEAGWWLLRSAARRYGNLGLFHGVDDEGLSARFQSNYENGVSPAFRIAE